MGNYTRRDVLKTAAAGVAGLTLASAATASTEKATGAETMIGVPFERKDKLRLGMIGMGGRGQGVLGDWMGLPDVEIVAICDVVPARLKESQAALQRHTRPAAAEYGSSDTDYKRLVERDDLDFVYIATPWDWHVPMAIDAMKAGKHCGTEVPSAMTVDNCWLLVNTSEQTRRHCMIMENCCYGEMELMVLNMVRKGLLGTLTHGAGAYDHDLRSLLLADSGEGLWRRFPHMKRNGNFYPTHGLGPVCNYMSINRGDRLESMVSLSSLEAGLSEYRDLHLKPDDPKRKEKYTEGDVNTSVIRTENGRTIMLQHTVTSARPYSRINMIQGTRGIFSDYPARIYVDERSKNDDWESVDGYKEEFAHDLWRKSGDMARKMGGHGGMDFLMCFRLLECFQNGTPPDIDVYDAATWSVPGPLSEASVKRGGAPQKFPDFTRGHYKDRKGIVGL